MHTCSQPTDCDQRVDRSNLPPPKHTTHPEVGEGILHPGDRGGIVKRLSLRGTRERQHGDEKTAKAPPTPGYHTLLWNFRKPTEAPPPFWVSDQFEHPPPPPTICPPPQESAFSNRYCLVHYRRGSLATRPSAGHGYHQCAPVARSCSSPACRLRTRSPTGAQAHQRHGGPADVWAHPTSWPSLVLAGLAFFWIKQVTAQCSAVV